MAKFKNVLFLGNGLNISFNRVSWSQLLSDMSGGKDFKSDLPMPLQAVIATHNNVDVTMERLAKSLYGDPISNEYKDILSVLLEAGFDDIITTNYSYELEMAARSDNQVTDSYLNGIRRSTKVKGPAEGKYFIHTYNEVTVNSVKNRVWHIHGAARNPSSMVIGHYYYGNLLSKYKNYFDDEVRNNYSKPELANDKSWLDSFVIGNVFMLGYGLDPSDMDIWWLLDRKHREKADHGNVYYYAPSWEDDYRQKEKYSLLRCYGAEPCTTGTKEAEGYLKFYIDAIQEILSESGLGD